MSVPRETAHLPHLLPAFVAGTLEPGEAQAVQAHLTECSACRAEMAAWRAIQAALRDPVPEVPADDGVLQAVWQRLDTPPARARPAVRASRAVAPHGLPPTFPDLVSPHATCGMPAVQPVAPPRGMRPWTAVQLACLLVLVTLGLGVATLGPGRTLLLPYLPIARTITLPAPGLTGADSEARLVEVTVPAAMVAAGEHVRSCLSHIVVPPRTRASWDAKDAVCCPGTRLTYVLSGSLAVWPGGPAQVIRADRTSERVAAGAALHLATGDTLLLGSDTPYRTDNPGDTPTGLLQYILAYPPDFPRGTATLQGWDEFDYDMPDLPVPEGPVTLTLSRFMLAPDSVLSGPSGMALMQVTMPPGSAADAPNAWWTVSSTIAPSLQTTITNDGRTPVAVYVLALEPQGGLLMSP